MKKCLLILQQKIERRSLIRGFTKLKSWMEIHLAKLNVGMRRASFSCDDSALWPQEESVPKHRSHVYDERKTHSRTYVASIKQIKKILQALKLHLYHIFVITYPVAEML